VSRPAPLTSEIDVVSWRIGYGADPWAWVPWEFAPFGGRFDDAHQQFRVLYAGKDRLTCFLEVLAHFRPDLPLVTELDEIQGSDDDARYGETAVGVVDAQWLAMRTMGRATLTGLFVDVTAKESLAWLRPRMAARAVHYGIRDIDGATIREADRRLTQEISTLLYSTRLDGRLADGLQYESRHGAGLTLWAIYERPMANDGGHSQALSRRTSASIDVHDDALVEAMGIHGLRFA